VEIYFKLSNLLALPFWVLILFLPRWRLTEHIIRSPWIAAGPAVLYALLMLPHLSEHLPLLLRPELNEIANLLGSREGATIGWTHFLAFDLFVGRWIYLDSRQRGVSAWFMCPVLFLTLLLGPVGFLLHLCLRRLVGREDTARCDSLVPKVKE
jgi:hypothetical protein